MKRYPLYRYEVANRTKRSVTFVRVKRVGTAFIMVSFALSSPIKYNKGTATKANEPKRTKGILSMAQIDLSAFLPASELPKQEKGSTSTHKQLAALDNGIQLAVPVAGGLYQESYQGRTKEDGTREQKQRPIIKDVNGVTYLCPTKLAEKVATDLDYAKTMNKAGVLYKIGHDDKKRVKLLG